MEQPKYIRTTITYSRATGERISEVSAIAEKGLNVQDAIEVFAKGFMDSQKVKDTAAEPSGSRNDDPGKVAPLSQASGQ